MLVNKIIIVHFNHYFGQLLPTEKSIDISLLKYELLKLKFDVDYKSYEQLANNKLDEDAYYLIGSHQNKDVKKYIDDICNIKLRNKKTIPSVDMILAHENKGIQAMLNNEYQLGIVNQDFLLINRDNYCETNKVSKFTSGSGSSGVFMANGNDRYSRYINNVFFKDLKIQDVVNFMKYKVLNFFYHQSAEHKKYFRRYFPVVIQDKIISKGFDYKCLIFFDKVYVLKRNVRSNDFRSSGSGNFEFIEVKECLLDFCLELRTKLNVPYVSLDIMETPEGFECIEFQCVHFGPYTQMSAPFHYVYDSKWSKSSSKVSLEKEMSYAIYKYLTY
ncbi:hypothetical protein [Photobacterium damselae]|nr:hypothetical protein [Photobacterium damselae]